jgi:hypothetical protein
VAVVDELIPAAFHNTEQYANNRIETDHGRLKARLRPMRGLKHERTARMITRGHAFMQNVRRGHYELGIEARLHRRVADAFAELTRRSDQQARPTPFNACPLDSTQQCPVPSVCVTAVGPSPIAISEFAGPRRTPIEGCEAALTQTRLTLWHKSRVRPLPIRAPGRSALPRNRLRQRAKRGEFLWAVTIRSPTRSLGV